MSLNTSGQEHSATNIEPWLATRSGKRFAPFHPKPEQIAIEDVAHGLAHKFRFGGQAGDYTVAQHCVLASVATSGIGPSYSIEVRQVALWGLLHDAAEAWLPDVPRPIKHNIGWLWEASTPGGSPVFQSFEAVEQRILRAVATRFGLVWPIPDAVHVADDRMLATEKRDLFRGDPWKMDAVPYGFPIEPWSIARAESEFLERFEELAGSRR